MTDKEPQPHTSRDVSLSYLISQATIDLFKILIEKIQNNEPLPKTTRKLPDKPVVKKSEEISAASYTRGERAISRNDDNEAIKAFTTALTRAPVSSKIFTDSYVSRSLALQKVKAFPDCLQDIEEALKLQLTEQQKESLLERKEIILAQSTEMAQIDEQEVTLSYGQNSEIPGVSSALDLVYNEQFGRHFVATQDIKIADVLMIQKPYVMATSEECTGIECYPWICEYCLKSTLAPIPCENCLVFLYCSVNCRSEAHEKYHKTECKLLSVKRYDFGPLSVIYLRTLIIATNHGEKFNEIFNLLKEIQASADKRTAGFKDGQFVGSSVNALLSLLSQNGNPLEVPSDCVRYFAKQIVALKQLTDFFRESDNLNSAGILQMSLALTCLKKLFTIRESSYKNARAFGMYPVLNLLNHSSECNVLLYDAKQGKKILRACRNIKKGEPVFIAYNGFTMLHDVKRGTTISQKLETVMMENSHYTCPCKACNSVYVYVLKFGGYLNLMIQLKEKLRQNPNDTESLWELLALVLGENKQPSLEEKIIQLALMNAYLGATIEEQRQMLSLLQIL